MDTILAIIGAITGIGGFVISAMGIIHNRYLAVDAYFSGVENPEFISARKRVYNTEDLSSIDEDVAFVINFFQHWGILAKKRYLPIWVFDTSAGAGVIRLFKLLEQYIVDMRKKNSDNSYAAAFEWLYQKLEKKKTQVQTMS